MIWRIALTPTAREMLAAVKDRRVRTKLAERIDSLANEPDKQGKPLASELSGYRSLRAVGQRYRIIYRIEKGQVVVLVVAVGLRQAQSRRDIYALAQRLVSLGLAKTA